MDNQLDLFIYTDNPEYDSFVEKFKVKKTTDDCYTPQNIYDVIADWVANEYGVDKSSFIRPFWPGGDYQSMDYPPGCVVVDNPPFSIRAQILDWYMDRDVKFFLFSPALTLLSRREDVCHIAAGANITYENGAEVITSFITNLETDGTILRSAPELTKMIEAQDLINRKQGKKELSKYLYPDEVVLASMVQRWGKYGVQYRLNRKDCMFIRGLDEQKASGKSMFGGGYLLSERAAAERAAAERAAAERAAAETFALSSRERALMAALSQGKPLQVQNEELDLWSFAKGGDMISEAGK